jgi:hypothetical protein
MHAPVSELWAAHEAGDDQWFWLHAGEDAAPTADQATGLLMFTWTPQTPFAQVRHISGVASDETLEGIVAAARRYILSHCEVRGMRATLWMYEEDEKFVIDKEVEAVFKAARFRWFQLQNTRDGRRGQVMQSTRYEDDPPLPKVPAGLGIRIATVVQLGEAGTDAGASGSSVDGPVLVAEALRKAAAEDEKPAGGDKHLAHVFTQLQVRDLRVPAVKACVADWPKVEEFCNDAFESEFAVDLAGLASQASGAAACACMSIVSYWPKGSALEDGHMCIPLQGYAVVPGTQHPVLYLPTVQDDLFVIILCGAAYPAEKVAEVLAAGEMLDPPVPAARVPLVSLRGAVPQPGMSGTTLGSRAVAAATHAFAIDFAEGARTPGALVPDAAAGGETIAVAAPFTLAVYHQDLGDAEVPLVVAHVA